MPVKPSRKIPQLRFILRSKFRLFNYEKKNLHREQNPFDYQAACVPDPYKPDCFSKSRFKKIVSRTS